MKQGELTRSVKRRFPGGKRFLAILLCLCMALTLMPTVAFADDPDLYDLWVNNEQLTSTNLTVQCGEGTAVYDPAAYTLTLDNAEITTGCAQDWLYSGIISYLPDLEIILVGENNSITNTGGEGINTYQTDVDYKCIRHDLTISGDGKLTVNQDNEWYGYGIYCTGDLTLDGVTLDLNCAASGLWTQWKMDITDCDIDIDTAMNGLVTNTGGTAPETDKMTGQGLITITNSTLDITTTGGNSNGILIAGYIGVGELAVESGDIEITAFTGISGKDSEGTSGSVTVNGGSIDITATNIVTDLDAFTLNNGVAIISGALDGTDCLIRQKYAVTVNGSYAGTTGTGSYAPGTTVTIDAGTRNNYTFTGWTVGSGGVTLQNASSATTTFEMPASAVTVTAGWSYNGGGGGDDPPYITYKVTPDSAAGSWIQNSNSGFAFVSNGAFRRFQSVSVDGRTLAASHYSAVEGSTVITLKPEYLNTLSAGTHTLRVRFADGSAQTTFSILEEDKTNPNTGVDNPFTDVERDDWFFEDVMNVYCMELMKGTSGTTFDPHGTTTRGMIVTILYRLEKEPSVTSDCPFDDVASGKYYEDAITWAAANKIVDGYGNAKFGPEDSITREQMAAILYRYAAFKGYDVSKAANLGDYIDAGSISSYALAPMKWANANGVVNGDRNKLMPTGNAERCQVAAIIYRFYKLFA